MEKLIECRNKIDEIDTKIIALYEQRMDVVKDVVAYKLENNMPVTDSNREAVMLEKSLKKIKCEEYKKYYESVLAGYLKASKDMQKEIAQKHKEK